MKIAIINQHLEDVIGGSELQSDLIAQCLEKRGHQVIYLAVFGKKEKYNVTYEVIPVHIADQKEFRQKVDQTGADVIYWRFNKNWFVESMKTVKDLGIPVIFSVSHKNDVQKYRTDLLQPQKNIKETVKRWMLFCKNFRQFRGFHYVDAISNQCRSFMGKTSVKREIYFPNSMIWKMDTFSWKKPYCIWASTVKPRKDPESAIYLAEKLNDQNLDILLIGEIQDERYNFFMDESKTPPNLHYLGVKKYDEVNGMIKNSLFLIHTCQPEGFPNNFIQAWSLGKPVVSLHYDPDGLIEKEGIGYYSKTANQFIKDVQTLTMDSTLRKSMGKKAKTVAKKNFESYKNIKTLEGVMAQVVQDGTLK